MSEGVRDREQQREHWLDVVTEILDETLAPEARGRYDAAERIVDALLPQPGVVYGVWARGETIHEGDGLLGLYRSRPDAEAAAANPPTYNKGSEFEESPECYTDEHPVLPQPDPEAIPDEEFLGSLPDGFDSGQPDPEAETRREREALDDLGAENLIDDLNMVRRRAERAEERLRACDQVIREVVETWSVSQAGPTAPSTEINLLRAVLSSLPEEKP